MADGAASVEVAADAYPSKSQDPEADGGPDDNVSLAPTDPEAPRYQSDAHNQLSRRRRRKLHRLVRRKLRA